MSDILFISRYYPPEKFAAAVCVSETARRLVRHGHQVTVLTIVPNYPTGVIHPHYRNCLCQEELIDGVRVVRVWSYISPNKGFSRRILAHLSFGCLAAFLAARVVGRPDLIIVGSPPLFNIIAGRILARLKRCPYIFWVADVWPEAAIQLGVLRNQVLIRLSEWLEWSSYQRAALVWAVTAGMRDSLIQRGLPAEHLFLLTNGVDTDKFRPLPQAPARVSFGWSDRFIVLYAGNHGLMYGLTTILDAAERLRNEANIQIVFVGDGAQKTNLVAEARRRGLQNVTFLDPLPHHQMPLLLAAADVCLISLKKEVLWSQRALVLKMFEIMACARPFILGAEGLICQVAGKEAGAAICIEPEDADALASAILYVRSHPKEAELLGQNGRICVEQHFDYDKLTAKLDLRLRALLETDSSGTQLAASVSASLLKQRQYTPPDTLRQALASRVHNSEEKE